MKWLLPPWLRVSLKIAPYVAIGLFAAALLQTRATLHNVRQQAALDAMTAKAAASAKEAGWALQGKQASETYAKAIADRQPIILHSIDKVQTYAATPAGRAPCLGGDRLRSIAEDRAALFSGDPATSAGALPTDPAGIGRHDQR